MTLLCNTPNGRKVHVLGDSRYARTICGLEDNFEWSWETDNLTPWKGLVCRKCLKGVPDHAALRELFAPKAVGPVTGGFIARHLEDST